MIDRKELTALLSDASAFGETGAVEHCQTHISDVYLTAEHAYKLLKPVNFGFLDFSTRESRYEECWNEVRLNRRLAPDVYLGVVPLTRSHGGMRVGGRGAPIDWLIKMRRLPDAATLEARVRAGIADRDDIDRILAVLVPFLRAAASGPDIGRAGEPASIRSNVVENLEVVDRLANADGVSAADAACLRSGQVQFLALRGDLFERRVSCGWIRDGHGDLKAEHFYFEERSQAESSRARGEESKIERESPHASRPTESKIEDRGSRIETESTHVFESPHASRPTPRAFPDVLIVDCIAFNARLRHVDALDEICFLAIDLERLHRPDLAEHLLREYLRAMDDPAPPELAAFYRSYRYCVRAKVACLRAETAANGERRRSLQLANECLSAAVGDVQRFHRPLLIAVCGMTGSGKSTIAKRLEQRIGAPRFVSDVIRKQLHGLGPLERTDDPELYSTDSTERTYAELRRLAAKALASSTSVVLDAAFLRVDERNAARGLADELGVARLFVECRCPYETAEQRIIDRARRNDDPSDAGLAVLRLHAKNSTAIAADGSDDVLTVDTRDDAERLVAQIVTRLQVL